MNLMKEKVCHLLLKNNNNLRKHINVDHKMNF